MVCALEERLGGRGVGCSCYEAALGVDMSTHTCMWSEVLQAMMDQ